MAEFVDRAVVIETIREEVRRQMSGLGLHGIHVVDMCFVVDAVMKIPTADVVQVVHCKDCARHTDEMPGMVYCPHIVGGWCDDDWFCKSGERRNDERSD